MNNLLDKNIIITNSKCYNDIIKIVNIDNIVLINDTDSRIKSIWTGLEYINNNLINVNQKFVKGNYILKKGDIINFSGKLKYFENLINSKRVFFIRSFLEIDFYTNTIIILQSPSEISTSEFSFLIKKYFDLNKFRYSFK